MRLLPAVLLLCGDAFGQVASIEGIVRDSRTGEPLARVTVELAGEGRAVFSGASGLFELNGLLPGEHLLKFSTVGYWLLRTRLTLGAGDRPSLEVSLTPDSLERRDTVEVRADPFDVARPSGRMDFAVEGGEVKNLAGVMADDPLRAAQSLPGVSSNDDFDSRFSIHGAPYSRLGVYLDGILLHMPFHTVQGEGPSGSLTAFNADVVDSMALQTEGYSPQYEDRTAGVLDVRTRDGSRSHTGVRAAAGVAGAGLMAEGPLAGRGSWLASVRRSYLQYLVKQAGDEPAVAFGFTDLQVRTAWDLGTRGTLRLSVIDGSSGLDRSEWRDTLAVNTSMLAGYRFTLASLGWEYSAGGRFVANTRAAFLRERFDDSNRDANTLASGSYGEWVGKTDASWEWSRRATLDFGGAARRVRADGFADYWLDAERRTRVEGYRGSTLLAGGYAQQSVSAAGKRLQAGAGARWDTRRGGGATASPQAWAAVLPWSSARLQLSWGQYAQFPDPQSLYSVYGDPRLLPERATHLAAAVEQRIGRLARLRVSVYRRDDRDLLFRPWMEPRLIAGEIAPYNPAAPIRNTLTGRAEGVEFFVQRRTANRLTGWASYSYGRTRQHDAATGAVFPADQDQRHTVNVYVGYRVRPSVHLSTRWSYGSGFPVPGWYRPSGGGYVLAEVRNASRLPAYQRTDVRINKSRAFDRWKLTVYAEVVNLFNAANYRFDSYNGYDASGRANLSFTKMFPALPSAGVMAEF